jgi:SAM-dependent methyltransferase
VRSIERFSDRVADYVRYRPRYPATVLDVLRRDAGLSADLVVADIGAGTGFSAELFLEHGNEVVCVEPNAGMRAAAAALLGERPRLRIVDGTAEATGLGACSIDMVVAAQAFHWFDAVTARREFVRILRPGGYAVLMWNTRRIDASRFLYEYEQLLIRHGTDYAAVRHDHADRAIVERFFGGSLQHASLYNEQQLDLNGLVGRVLSSSYTPAADDPRRAPLLRDLEQLFAAHQHAGRVRLEYDTDVNFGRLDAPAASGTETRRPDPG